MDLIFPFFYEFAVASGSGTNLNTNAGAYSVTGDAISYVEALIFRTPAGVYVVGGDPINQTAVWVPSEPRIPSHPALTRLGIFE